MNRKQGIGARLGVCVLLSAAALWALPLSAQACTSGVANAEVTVDGRPLLWKSRMEAPITNEVQYYPAGVDHDGDGAPDPYSYLGVAPSNARLRMGVSSQGMATACNTLNGGVQSVPHHIILGNYTTMAQAKALHDSGALDAIWRDLTFVIDSHGAAGLWEGAPWGWSPPVFYEYDAVAPARDSQYCNGVSLSGWIVRDNTGHYWWFRDGGDNTYLLNAAGGRYGAGINTVSSLINAGDLSSKTILRDFMRHPTIAHYSVVSSMVAAGVHPHEDPRLTTMWAQLGYARTSIAVPVWVHGVESAGGAVPGHLAYDPGNPTQNLGYLADRMRANGWSFAQVEARTVGFEGHLCDVVDGVLLPSWRARSDWAAIGQEMDRVSLRMCLDAHALLAHLEAHGADSNNAPTASIDSAVEAALSVWFACTGFDDDDLDGLDDGEAVTFTWDYGGAGFLAGQTYTYDQAGTYLVSLTVTDAEGLSQTDWAVVTPVPEPSAMALLSSAAVLVLSKRRRRKG